MGRSKQSELFSDSAATIAGVGVLSVLWHLDPQGETLNVVWQISELETGEVRSAGSLESPLDVNWAFAEAGWLVRKLRELHARVRPF